jgi:hypothetical protein
MSHAGFDLLDGLFADFEMQVQLVTAQTKRLDYGEKIGGAAKDSSWINTFLDQAYPLLQLLLACSDNRVLWFKHTKNRDFPFGDIAPYLLKISVTSILGKGLFEKATTLTTGNSAIAVAFLAYLTHYSYKNAKDMLFGGQRITKKSSETFSEARDLISQYMTSLFFLRHCWEAGPGSLEDMLLQLSPAPTSPIQSVLCEDADIQQFHFRSIQRGAWGIPSMSIFNVFMSHIVGDALIPSSALQSALLGLMPEYEKNPNMYIPTIHKSLPPRYSPAVFSDLLKSIPDTPWTELGRFMSGLQEQLGWHATVQFMVSVVEHMGLSFGDHELTVFMSQIGFGQPATGKRRDKPNSWASADELDPGTSSSPKPEDEGTRNQRLPLVEKISVFPKRKMPLPKFDHFERHGPERHDGHVTESQLAEQFGLRAIEYGNYVTQNERQVMLDEAYDALADIQDVLKITGSAVGIHGRLALALGSRGHGNAAAHYECGKRVINLTKTRGPGALGHEWCHAVDHYASLQYRDSYGFSSEESGSPFNRFVTLSKAQLSTGTGGIRRALRLHLEKRMTMHVVSRYLSCTREKDIPQKLAVDALLVVMDEMISLALQYDTMGTVPYYVRFYKNNGQWVASYAYFEKTIAEILVAKNFKDEIIASVSGLVSQHMMSEIGWFASSFPKIIKGMRNQSEFYRGAQMLDMRKSTPYWTTVRELFARAGSAAIHDILADQHLRNDFLSAYSAPSVFTDPDRYVASSNPEGAERPLIRDAFIRHALPCLQELLR